MTTAPHPKTAILSAPPGWGKTRQAQQLRSQLGCTQVLDDWSPRMGITTGALHLTNIPPQEIEASGILTNSAALVARGW